MDIAAPKLDERVAPATRLLLAQGVDHRSLVRELAQKHPEAGADQIAAMCHAWGLPVSGVLVARIVQAVRNQQRVSRSGPQPVQ